VQATVQEITVFVPGVGAGQETLRPRKNIPSTVMRSLLITHPRRMDPSFCLNKCDSQQQNGLHFWTSHLMRILPQTNLSVWQKRGNQRPPRKRGRRPKLVSREVVQTAELCTELTQNAGQCHVTTCSVQITQNKCWKKRSDASHR
jgi:hypothetical protein